MREEGKKRKSKDIEIKIKYLIIIEKDILKL